jgi:phenylacetate 2-hydroxylase
MCVTMIAGGLDTLPGNIIMFIAYLSSVHGQEIQKRALEEIEKVYPDGNAWEKCLEGEHVPYVTALVKEALRWVSAFRICLPRTSVRPITYEGAVIPAGTTFLMVS